MGTVIATGGLVGTGAAEVTGIVGAVGHLFSEVIAPDGGFDVRWATVFLIAYVLKVFDEGLTPEAAVAQLRFGQPLCVSRDGQRVECSAGGTAPV